MGAVYEAVCEKPEPRLDTTVFPSSLCDYVAACLTRDADKRMDALSLTKHDFVVTGASTPSDFAVWLQEQGFGTALYPLDEDDAENAKTTMTQPDDVPSGKGPIDSTKLMDEQPKENTASTANEPEAKPSTISPSPPLEASTGRPQPRRSLDEPAPQHGSEHLPIQLQRLPLERLKDVRASLRTLSKNGLSL